MIEAIRRRRSVRKFLPGAVPAEATETMLRAAMQAPTAGDQRPWVFVVIDDRAILDRVVEFHKSARLCLEAPVAILVCCDLAREKHKGLWEQDCAAAVENMLLQAVDLGLGACWVCLHPRPEREAGMRALVGLPEGIVPFALVPFGRPGEEKGFEDRFDPSRIRRNRW